MKHLFLAVWLFAAASAALAQFSPNTVLTAAALNSALAAPAITGGSINGNTSILTTGAVTLNGVNNLNGNSSATTQSYLDNSNLIATSSFVKRSILAASATIPFTITSGSYNFASTGSGAIFGVTTGSGAVASITSIVAGGTGYQVGDCLVLIGGNGDAVAYVSAVSGGVVTAATVLYGGTGYTGTPQLTGSPLPPGSRSGALTGALTGNVTIIVPSGTLLAGARRFGFQNNTTGAFTVTVKLSNGSGGSTGTGVVLPQGVNNNTSMTLYTDGVTDVWPEMSATQPVYSAAGVVVTRPKIVQGQTAAIAGGTASVTFTGGAVFASSSSYVCTATDTGGANAVQVTQSSGSSVTFNGTNGHIVNYHCIGN